MPIISPVLILFRAKGCFAGLIFQESLFLEGLIVQRNFAFQNGLGLTIKTAQIKDYKNSLKQLKTASTNSPWAYIQEGLLSEGFLRLRFGGLLSEFYHLVI